MDLKKIVEDIKKLAIEVGKYQVSKFRSVDLLKDSKSTEIDLVTEVDKESEKRIVTKLKELFPTHGILGEEGSDIEGEGGYRWVIDPLDGTVNYASGIPVFAVSIALEYQGKSILGVVHCPYINETFWGTKDGGAFLNGKPISVGTRTKLVEAVVGTGFPYDRATAGEEKNNSNYFRHLMPRVRGVRRIGAAAYDLCLVACGILDGYWEMFLKPWDMAAAQIIIEEAGGYIHHFREDRDISITAGNREISDLLLEAIEYVDNEGIEI